MSEQPPAIRGEIVEASPTTNPAMAYLASLRSAGSRDVMRRKLDGIARLFGRTWDTMPWHTLTKAHIDAIVSKQVEYLSPATVNHTLAALKGVMGAAFDLGLLDGDALMRIRRIKSVRGGRTSPAGRYVSIGEREALIRACDGDTHADQRDAAILLLLCAAGLRRAEVAALDHQDILQDDAETEMTTLGVLGKGRKQREAYLNDGARDAMMDWLAVRGSAPGPLFWSGHKGGDLHQGQRMSAQAVYDIVKRRATQGGVKALTPHDLRRSWVSDLLDNSVDIATVAKMAGHANVQTTERYDRRGERASKSAARTLHFAYRRRGASEGAKG